MGRRIVFRRLIVSVQHKNKCNVVLWTIEYFFHSSTRSSEKHSTLVPTIRFFENFGNIFSRFGLTIISWRTMTLFHLISDLRALCSYLALSADPLYYVYSSYTRILHVSRSSVLVVIVTVMSQLRN